MTESLTQRKTNHKMYLYVIVSNGHFGVYYFFVHKIYDYTHTAKGLCASVSD